MLRRSLAVLELRPNCEHCNRPLPPASTEALICTFECTFCVSCGRDLFHAVCPNCGGNFTARPIRPAKDWNDGNFLGKYPASTTPKLRPKDLDAHARLVAAVQHIAPQHR
jgi:uncharacterized protein